MLRMIPLARRINTLQPFPYLSEERAYLVPASSNKTLKSGLSESLDARADPEVPIHVKRNILGPVEYQL